MKAFIISVFLTVFLLFPLLSNAHNESPQLQKPSKFDYEILIKNLEKFSSKKYCGRAAHIFDAHFHYHSNISDGLSPDQILSIMDAVGIRRAFLSSAPNENSMALYRLAPDRFYLGVMPYRTRSDIGTWTYKDTNKLSKIAKHFLTSKEFPASAFGEFHLKENSMYDRPIVKELVQFATKRGLFLQPHTSAVGIKKLFAMAPNSKILWAHAGSNNQDLDATPGEIAKLMDQFPNLYIEISANSNVGSGPILNENWRRLFIDKSDRVLMGTDPYLIEKWEELPKTVEQIRSWLCQLPQDVAENLAWKTADRLMSNPH